MVQGIRLPSDIGPIPILYIYAGNFERGFPELREVTRG
jgi:hypothetical protein